MNMRAEFFCNTSEEIELVLEFAKKIEALRAKRYPQAMNSLVAGANANLANTTGQIANL